MVFRDTGLPAAGAMLVVGDHVVTADEDGGFVATLPEGEHTLVIGEEAWTFRVVDAQATELLVTLGQGVAIEAPPEQVEIAVTGPPGRLLGTLHNAEDGRPLAGARIYVRGLDVEGITDASGAFAMDLPAGELELSIILINGLSNMWTQQGFIFNILPFSFPHLGSWCNVHVDALLL